MFKCRKCRSIDKFELMFSPDYKGAENFSIEYNENKDIKITAGIYTFIPNLAFMNNYAVCSYCGGINCWDYEQ